MRYMVQLKIKTMKHKHKNRILGRTQNHRQAMLGSMSHDLLEHGSIITTEAKAKEIRRFIEPLISYAKQDITLSIRRNLLRKGVAKNQINRLKQVAEIHADRPGGYTRLTRLPRMRDDGATMSKIDIIDFKAAK